MEKLPQRILLRHTSCSRMAEAGVDPRTLQDIMGHASMKMTMELYNHVTDERLTNEIQKLNSSKNMHFFKFNKNSQKKQITS